MLAGEECFKLSPDISQCQLTVVSGRLLMRCRRLCLLSLLNNRLLFLHLVKVCNLLVQSRYNHVQPIYLDVDVRYFLTELSSSLCPQSTVDWRR